MRSFSMTVNEQKEFPAPPAEFIRLATGGTQADIFLATGKADQETILAYFHEIGVFLNGSRAKVLDWGCGCGRLACHWASSADKVDLFGCDVA
jgi:predicted RNA methylase